MPLAYDLTFAGIPFVSDFGRVFRMDLQAHEKEEKQELPPRRHQPLSDLLDEVNRRIPFLYLQDFIDEGKGITDWDVKTLTTQYKAKFPNPDIRVGDWYYPPTMCRWSVFRMLATSAEVKAMIEATDNMETTGTFKMKVIPVGPGTRAAADYSIETEMSMLPPRPLAEHGGSFNGLFLVTLVDDRYYFQGSNYSLTVTKDSTWVSLFTALATQLNITLTLPAIPTVYSKPEPDSELWSRVGSIPVLLDALAANVGCTIVREYDGTYSLITPTTSITRVNSNRRSAFEDVVRTAGGDMFTADPQLLPSGDLSSARNAVIPRQIDVTFPQYVNANDPIPHFINSRYRNQRPTAWTENTYPDVYTITIPIGACGGVVAGLVGTGDGTIRTTAKAYYDTEHAAAFNGAPTNDADLQALALKIATDYYTNAVGAGLDEVYPGTIKWDPEGFHDIIWSVSVRNRQGVTRVMRNAWNQGVRELQIASPAPSGKTTVPGTVGGHTVPQTWHGPSGTITTSLRQTLNSGDTTAFFATGDNLPTQNRWRGQIGTEIILFEGTSGGRDVGIVFRGVDGTIETDQGNASTITKLRDVVYGVNYTSVEKMGFVYQGAWTSGGVCEAVRVPQTQSVYNFSASGLQLNGVLLWSGRVNIYDATKTPAGQWPTQELVWLVDRNNHFLQSGKRYDGQLVGYSKSGALAPIYAVNEYPATSGGGVSPPSQTWTLVGITTTSIAAGYPGLPTPGIVNIQTLTGGGVLVPTGSSIVVYNEFPTSIPSGAYVIITLEPFSNAWFVTQWYPPARMPPGGSPFITSIVLRTVIVTSGIIAIDVSGTSPPNAGWQAGLGFGLTEQVNAYNPQASGVFWDVALASGYPVVPFYNIGPSPIPANTEVLAVYTPSSLGVDGDPVSGYVTSGLPFGWTVAYFGSGGGGTPINVSDISGNIVSGVNSFIFAGLSGNMIATVSGFTASGVAYITFQTIGYSGILGLVTSVTCVSGGGTAVITISGTWNRGLLMSAG